MSELLSKQLKQPLRVVYLQTRVWSILHFHVFKEELRVAKKFSYAKEIRPNRYKLTHPSLSNCPSTRALERQKPNPHEDQSTSGVSYHRSAPGESSISQQLKTSESCQLINWDELNNSNCIKRTYISSLWNPKLPLRTIVSSPLLNK